MGCGRPQVGGFNGRHPPRVSGETNANLTRLRHASRTLPTALAWHRLAVTEVRRTRAGAVVARRHPHGSFTARRLDRAGPSPRDRRAPRSAPRRAAPAPARRGRPVPGGGVGRRVDAWTPRWPDPRRGAAGAVLASAWSRAATAVRLNEPGGALFGLGASSSSGRRRRSDPCMARLLKTSRRIGNYLGDNFHGSSWTVQWTKSQQNPQAVPRPAFPR
jgi:hypothetical protein